MGQSGEPPEEKGKGRKILLLTAGGFVLVAIIGIGLALLLGNQGGEPTAQPHPTQRQLQPGTEQPTKRAETPAAQPLAGGVDKGISAGNGIFVQPAPGYSPQVSKAVLLLTQDRACFLNLIVIKDAKFKGTATLRDVVDDERKTLHIGHFTTGAPETKRPDNPDIEFMASMAWSGTINAAKGPMKVAGYTTLIHRKDDIVSWVRFMTPAGRASQERQNRDQMLDSIAASQ